MQQVVRNAAACQGWSRVSAMEQVVSDGAGCQGWSRLSGMEQVVRDAASYRMQQVISHGASCQRSSKLPELEQGAAIVQLQGRKEWCREAKQRGKEDSVGSVQSEEREGKVPATH